MSESPEAASASLNDWLAQELYQEYLNNRTAVDTAWKGVFDSDAPTPAAPTEANPVATRESSAIANTPAPAPASKPVVQQSSASDLIARASAPPKELGPAEQLVPLRGTAARIAENMNLSLAVPTATSYRSIPVKVIDENRTLINQSRSMSGKSKISYTHIIAYAISKALHNFPNVNSAYAETDGQPFRWVKGQVNLGLAIDVAAKDGTRSLVVPSIKNTGQMNFQQFLNGFDELVKKGRLDYIVFVWALVPVLWKRDEPFDWLRPRWWRDRLDEIRAERRSRTRRLRTWLGLPHGSPGDRQPHASERPANVGVDQSR